MVAADWSAVPDDIREHVGFGIHALVWAGDTSDESVTPAITQTKKAGYDLLESSLHGAAV
jgi:hypothetical protein